MKPLHKLTLLSALLALGGCGGGGGGDVAGIGGTGKVASGTITAFGSIFVNGDEYEIDTANCEVDDSDVTGTCQSNLRIGMVVSVSSDDFSGTSGTATDVIYDDNVEGPVSGLILDGSSKRFTVLGVSVVVDAASTTFDNNDPTFTFDTIADGDVVEVSGLFDANGVLNATYIEKQGLLVPNTTLVELKGTVSSAGAGAGVGDTFVVNGITVTIGAGADLSDVAGGLVTDGLFVEVKGVFVDPSNVTASRVEVEDGAFGDDEDDASVEGLISEFNSISDFKVAGIAVDASSASIQPSSLQLANGIKVEAEGAIVNGTLIADEIKAEGGEIKIDASVLSADSTAGTITLTLGSGPGQITVNVDAGTEMEDESGGNITVANLSPGDFLEVRAYDDGGGNLVATEIRRSSDSDNDVSLRGPLDSFDTGANTITVLGIQFGVDGSTEYENENDVSLGTGNTGAASFAAAVSVGDIVKVEDEDPSGGGTPNGVADEIDLES